jgi:hypothetical protein
MTAKKTKASEPVVIEAYKAFDKNMQCRGFQYEVGQTYQHSGTVSLCDRGFHSCADPLDVLNYYDITDGIRFAKVRASGKIDTTSDGDSKIASAEIHIEAELKLPEFLGIAIKWIAESCKGKAGNVDGSITRGHSATNASSGHSAKNASSGHSAKNASSGHYATNASSGHYATNASSGHYATNASSGHSAKNASSGHYAKNEASGEHSVIAGAGRNTWAKGAKGVWISLAEYKQIDGAWRCVGFAAGQAGYKKVPADIWLKAEGGKLVPA